MAKNQELEKVVITEIYNHLLKTTKDPALKDVDYKGIENFIKMHSETLTDKDYKIRIKFKKINCEKTLIGPLMGYGFDFNKQSEDGTSAKDIYNGLLKHKRNGETLLVGGITNRFGWYISELDK